MRKHILVSVSVAGVGALLLTVSACGLLASDRDSSSLGTTSSSPAGAAQPGASAREEITLLKQQMAIQQQQMGLQKRQIEQMAKAMEEQKRLLEQLTRAISPAVPPAPSAKPVEGTVQASQPRASSLGEVASTSPIIPTPQKKLGNAAAPLSAAPIAIRAPRPAPGAATEASPLQFHIGTASITPVGFMDFTSVFRTHAAGGSIGTNFANIPYGTSSYQANLSELRMSMQNSRLGFRADADVMGAHVMGYVEADFNGTNPGNIAVSTNSNTMRSRVFWLDVRRGKWEVMGGQSWSLITPGRAGISPLPGDVFYSQNVDVDYQAGLFWGRIPELRFVYHPSKQVALALALDSPDQYAGGSAGGPLITLPSGLSSSAGYQGELDYNGGNALSTPNLAPDIIAKLALDPNKRAHLEIGGVERNFKVYNPATTTTYSAAGAGGFLNLHFEPVKGFRLLTNNFWSDGGGRYIFGQAPDLIAHADGSLSLIHAGSSVSGFEFTRKKSLLFAYYGGIYVGRNTAVDSNGNLIGYGYQGASAAQNRTIQEATFGINQTIWKDARWGAINFMGQYSYLTRNPWYVAAGAPANASLNMVFFNLRYTLPGSAPTLGK